MAFLVMAAIVFFPFFSPQSVPNLTRNSNFLPMSDLFLVTGAGLAIMAILSVHPLITDGEEIRTMDTPFSHPGIHANLLMLIILVPFLFYLQAHPIPEWQANRMLDILSYLLLVTLGSTILVILGFYTMRAKAQEARHLRRQKPL
jgi:hypothetical protein